MMWNCGWVSCEVNEKGLKLSKTNSVENEELQSESHDSQLSTTFEWLDGKKNDSIVIPLGEDEEFCCGDEEVTVESDIEQEVALLELDDDEITDRETDLEDADNGKILPLFISHILCCEPYQKGFKLGSLIFKTVKIFGTIVATQITNRKNTLLLDDGTAQIMCFMEDSVNDLNLYEESYDETYSADSPYYEFSQFYKKKTKECEYTLPTFDKINIGDSVLIEGNISLHKDNFYLFIQFLNRPEGTNSYVDFVENVFELYETYYDFGNIDPLKSHIS